MPTATQKEVKELREDIAQIKDLIAGKAEDAASNGALKVISKEEFRDAAQKAGKNLRHYFSHKAEQFDHARESTERTIKKHPLSSAAVAFAGGALLASLFARRS